MLSPVRQFDLAVYGDVAEAEATWRGLERGGALATPYQRYDLLAPWCQHVGARRGVTPFLVAGFDSAGAPAFLLPFGRTRRNGLDIVHFLGGKHANFNMGIWRRDIAATVTDTELRRMFDRLVADGHAVDLVAMLRQPAAWDGVVNPFALLPHQPSADHASRLTFPPAVDGEIINQVLGNSMRSRLRNKQRKLEKLPGYRYTRASSTEDVERLLSAFFCIKARHMAERGINNAFSEAGVEDFVREICLRDVESGQPPVEIHALEGNGELLALFAGIDDGRRFSCMFNTYTLSEHARHSPGLILLRDLVGHCGERGFTSFDIGVGLEGYKSFFCKEPEPLFDSFLPMSTRGRLVTPAYRAGFAAKRAVKGTPSLWNAIQKLRRLRGQQSADAGDDVRGDPPAASEPRLPGAIVLGGAHGSLAVARSLGRKGIPVWMVTNDHPLPTLSRFVQRTFTWDGPKGDAALRYLIDLAREHGLAGWVLFPAADPDVRFVAEHHAALAEVFRSTTQPWDTLQWAVDKRLAYERAQSLGIGTPQTYAIHSAADVANFAGPFPVIVKPSQRATRNALTLAKAWRVDNSRALAVNFREAAALVGSDDVIVQELIPGDGATEFSYAGVWRDGRPLASAVVQRLRQYPTEFGIGSFVALADRPDIEKAAKRFLASLRYTGMVEIDFKHDARDGIDKLLDVNPRPWSWLSLCEAAGFNVPYLTWQIAAGQPTDRVGPLRRDVHWLHGSRDAVAAWTAIMRGRLTLPAYLRSLTGSRIYACFATDDPKPGLLDMPLVMHRMLRDRLPLVIRSALGSIGAVAR